MSALFGLLLPSWGKSCGSLSCGKCGSRDRLVHKQNGWIVFCVVYKSSGIWSNLVSQHIRQSLNPLQTFAELRSQGRSNYMNFMNWIKELSIFVLSIKAIYLFPSPADIILPLSRSHISNQLLFSSTNEKKMLSGPHWKWNDVHSHLMRKQVQVIIRVIMLQQLITSNICDNCKQLITVLCFSCVTDLKNTFQYPIHVFFHVLTICVRTWEPQMYFSCQ